MRGGRGCCCGIGRTWAASSVCFSGPSESAMQADALAGLLRRLDLAPAVLVGGSGGLAGVAAHREPPPRRGPGRGGVVDQRWRVRAADDRHLLLRLVHPGRRGTAGWRRCSSCPSGRRSLERNPANRERFLALDPKEFIATLEQWLAAYCPCAEELMPGLSMEDARTLDVPTLVFRSGRERHAPHPGSCPSRWRRCCPTPPCSSRPGATPSGSSARLPGRPARAVPALAAARPAAARVGRARARLSEAAAAAGPVSGLPASAQAAP